MKTDIAKILQEIKLPERRTPDLAAEKHVAHEQKPIDALLAAEPEASSEGVHRTPSPEGETMQQPAEADSSVTPLRTLKQDLQHVVRDQKVSVVRAVSLEQGKKHAEPIDGNEVTPPWGGHLRAIVIAIVLFFLGGAALAGVYIVMQQNAAPLPQQGSDSLVFAEQSVAFPLDQQSPSALKNQLAQARAASNASLGSITRIVPVIGAGTQDADGAAQKRPATLSEFLKALGARAPEDLLRALSDQYFFGIHTVDKNAPVFVISVTSYDRAFAGMLAWEKNMNADLAPAFTPVPALTLDETGLPMDRTFTDVVMRNYDVRALKDDSGAIQLYYSFPTRDILVIAESPYTFTEILSRLQAGRKL